MTNITPELIEKAKATKSAEELLALAKENNVEMNEEQAKVIFSQLNTSGELSEDELDNVSGGGCGLNKIAVNGLAYTATTSSNECFTGHYEDNYEDVNGKYTMLSTDNKFLRKLWEGYAWGELSGKHCCGTCRWLGFKNGYGYCTKEGK